ncbi:hypothetical protein NQ186_10150 [Pseudomonas zeae]|uniref:hypothetical protein n=1 Tax=Pseudomonas zeae TaxID=2745510 RepID=UPI0021472979|nr:hypothetical protein [Pseudomonas zeae]UUT14526.1 hypothetical protein NQ186_10150 [Pseudomonas zeae]
MTTKQRFLMLALFAFGFFLLFYGTPRLLTTEYAALGFFSTVAGISIVFITLLEIVLERFIKGMWLIALGVFYPIFYPQYLNLVLHPIQIPDDIGKQIELLNQVILLACSGAGGSIIANYADTNTREYRAKINVHPQTIDNTQKIEDLISYSKTMNKKFNFLILACLALLLAIAAAVIVKK